MRDLNQPVVLFKVKKYNLPVNLSDLIISSLKESTKSDEILRNLAKNPSQKT